MRIFVTGIAGFIGSTVAELLRDCGHQVSGCDDLSLGRWINVPEGIDWDVGDLRDMKAINADVVVHLAAMSTCVAPDPLLGAYAGSKWACENILPDATIFRFANVYGPKQRDWGAEPGVLAAWQKAEAAGEPIRIDGDGSQTRDFIHVDDVARAILLACESDEGDGHTMDICTGVQTPVIELADHFDAPREFAPRNPVDPDSMPQDPEPAARVLGFRSAIEL